MALSTCNAVSNPSFETGDLSPWRASAVNVAKISSGTTAYSGDYYLNLQTAVGNRGNTISQGLRNLKRHAQYKFSVQAQAPFAGSECFVYAYMGRNATVGSIASAELFNAGEWTEVSGTYVPKREQDILSIVATCISEDSSVTGNILFDDVSFAPADCPYGLE